MAAGRHKRKLSVRQATHVVRQIRRADARRSACTRRHDRRVVVGVVVQKLRPNRRVCSGRSLDLRRKTRRPATFVAQRRRVSSRKNRPLAFVDAPVVVDFAIAAATAAAAAAVVNQAEATVTRLVVVVVEKRAERFERRLLQADEPIARRSSSPSPSATNDRRLSSKRCRESRARHQAARASANLSIGR